MDDPKAAELRRKAGEWDAWCQFAHEHGGVAYVEFFDGSGLGCPVPPPADAPCTCGLPEQEHCVPSLTRQGVSRSE